MADLSSIPNFHLKLIFLVHFLLISLSCLGHWTPPGYLFYNFILVLLLLWAIHDTHSPDSVQLAFAVNVSAIILDVLVLSFCYPSGLAGFYASEKLSAGIAIIHVIVRPFTTIYIVKLVRERTGDSNFLANVIPASTSAPRADSYEDIDRTAEARTGAYDFSSAQQI